MSSPADFLTTLAQAVSTMNLYEDGHPARERAIDRSYEKLVQLQEERLEQSFTFLGEEILVGDRPLRELRSWDWGPRLASVGVQRLEFVDPVTRDDFEAFLEEVYERIAAVGGSSAEVRQGRPSAIRYGEVGIRGDVGGADDRAEAGTATTKLGYSLAEEIEGVGWLHDELKDRRVLHLVEAEGIVRSLSVAMHGDQAFLLPMLRLKEYDQYTVTHTLNVSVLTMALAEYLGLGPREVRAFGIAGLLHDLGKVKIPEDILNKPGKLTDAERQVMNNHTIEGARIIIETEENLDMAAVVAYEHHIRIDGGGYPSLRYQRACHQASDLVHVCDVFDALRTDRPYRGAWETDRVLGLLEEGAGTEFDRDVALAFVKMMRQWEGQVTEITPESPELTLEVAVPGEAEVSPGASGGAASSPEAPRPDAPPATGAPGD